MGLISGQEDPPEKEIATHSNITCLENSMDRGAWQVTDYGVAKVGPDLGTKPLCVAVSKIF